MTFNSKGREMRLYKFGKNKFFAIIEGKSQARATKVIRLQDNTYYITVDADEVDKIKVVDNTIVIDV